jgi:hypothetical protein
VLRPVLEEERDEAGEVRDEGAVRLEEARVGDAEDELADALTLGDERDDRDAGGRGERAGDDGRRLAGGRLDAGARRLARGARVAGRRPLPRRARAQADAAGGGPRERREGAGVEVDDVLRGGEDREDALAREELAEDAGVRERDLGGAAP